MKTSVLIGVGSLALILTAGAQMPDKRQHEKGQQKATTHAAYRGTSAVRQVGPQRTFSNARFRQPAFSPARFREPTPRTTRMQPRMNTSFTNRPAMTSTVARGPTRVAFSNDWSGSRFSARPRPSDAFVNRSEIGDIAARRQTQLAMANDGIESKFSERPRTSSSLLQPFTMNDTAARRETRTGFNNKWAESNFRREARTSFLDRSLATSPASREQRRAASNNNWRGDWFAGRQYWAFRNYQSQWHDSGWWHHHCDRIVFVTVYSQPFPFYFDAGYWYPAWGYYSDAYYPYDGPIYCYNDLRPDEIITNVQIQLYNEGYYSGPIDGILGPDTRAAIADYQADHGLAVTAAIDEPTVESLGLA
jgi:putative peptidoglycan binding protein